MIEAWRYIPGYGEDYEVSTMGKVKSNKGVKVRMLKLWRNPETDYVFCGLCNGGKLKVYQAHQLVAMAFLGHKPCGHKLVVDHINGRRYDNRLVNLRVVTSGENVTICYSSKDRSAYTSKYIGVSKTKSGKYVAVIKIVHDSITLLFSYDELECAKYSKIARKIRDRFESRSQFKKLVAEEVKNCKEFKFKERFDVIS